MSWAAHDFETYALQRHLQGRVSYLGILAGTYAPDALTKWYVYGVDKGPIEFGAHDPALFHRGWPGAGFTHSLLFCVLLAGVAYYASRRNKAWGYGVLAGALAHVLTDTNDTLGVMLFFPFSTEHVTTGMWAYAAGIGRYDDAGAYYSCLGLVMDAFWLVVALCYRRVLSVDYFRSVVVPADPAWGWLGRRLPEVAMLAIYRTSFFYGTTRLIAWTVWAHVLHDYSWDLSWGGPGWVPAVHG